jgi:DnaJ-class molecular chaperone
MKTHYEILGVSPDANETDIKKAYRALSLKYHPDRNSEEGATQIFQSINEAYETMSDAERRQNYDMELKFGKNMGPPGNPFGGGGMEEFHDINNIFNMMFGGIGGGGIHRMGSMGGMHGMPEIRVFRNGPGGFHAEFSTNFRQEPPPPILKVVDITLEQCFHGVSLPVEIDKWTIINNMKINEIETLNITIPSGMGDEDTLVLKGRGNVINENLKGDVHLKITILNDTPFIRKGLDLYFSKNLTLKEALCGFSFEIMHLNGKRLSLNNTTNPTVIKPGFKRVVSNLGLTRENVTGNLIIDFDVEFPEHLTADQIEKLKEFL